MSYVLGLDAVVLGDGATGRSVGDVSVSSRVVLTRWCQVLSVDVCVTLTVCHEVT